MRKSGFLVAGFVGLATIVLPMLASAQQAHSDVSGLIAMMSVGASKTITFSDEHGHAISEATFIGRVQHGRSFGFTKDSRNQSTAFALEPVGTKPPVPPAVALKPTSGKLGVGNHFPAIDLPIAAGGRVDSASWSGKPTLVDFYFAECEACIEETAALSAYANTHPEMRVLAVTFDDQAMAKAYAAKWHFSWPIAFGGKAWIDAAGIDSYPTMVLVAADGKILGSRVGSMIHASTGKASAHDVQRWIHGLLARHDMR